MSGAATGWPKLDAALVAWAKLNILDAGAFTYFRESLKSRAGLLAGVWDQRFTAALYASILDAMSQGLGIEAWLPTAQKLIVEYGGVATLFPKGKFSSSYAELVFRMANASAMAAGRYAQMFAPGRVISDPYVLYSTMQDDRVRDEHAALDGMVFRKDDPDARALFPPSDFNCRCWLIELDATDVGDGGYRIARGGDFPRPPAGFDQDRVLELAPGVLRRAA